LCDVDGSKLVIRDDDREEVISERLAAYDRQTRLVAEYYKAQGRLVAINADRPMAEVTVQIFAVLESRRRQEYVPRSGEVKALK
jgi:adenylate kinase